MLPVCGISSGIDPGIVVIEFWTNCYEAVRFMCEAQAVMSARLMLFAWGDPSAAAEAGRMVSEKVLAFADAQAAAEQALADGRRESAVLAVKFGVPFGDSDPNHRGASRRWITEAVEGSLRRLQTDWIDLYQVGVPDPDTDIDETLGALSDLVHAGKIRSFGASKVPASQIVEAQWTAERRGHGRFRTEQPPYSLLTRAIEYDVLPACLRHGMGVMAYSPLAGGWLSGKYRKGRDVSGPGSASDTRPPKVPSASGTAV